MERGGQCEWRIAAYERMTGAGRKAAALSHGVRCLPCSGTGPCIQKEARAPNRGLAEMGVTAASLETTQITLCRVGGEKLQAGEELECFGEKMNP